MPSIKQKRALGQYFTRGNPFHVPAFSAWMERFWAHRPTLLEPFAGANHILRLVREAGWDAKWACFDTDPPSGAPEGTAVARRDTLKRYPHGFTAAITNPPYLARNSAIRRGLGFPYASTPEHDDLYKIALARMLAHTPYVAAIIPESFLTAGVFHDRLQAVVSLPRRMFEDTDHPVCLALFVPALQAPASFEVWDGARFLGTHASLRAGLPVPAVRHTWRFNDPCGSIALHAVDNHAGASIRFAPGTEVSPANVKHTSRAITRIGGAEAGTEAALIAGANEHLARYREATHDTLLTAFKGLRRDGRYRRRLDFAQARHLLDLARSGASV